jgi:hypothetical protein
MMKKVLFSALAALALTGMGSAFAADPQDATVQIRASGDYKLGVGEFDDYAFTYGLSTGQKIKFTRTAGQHFYAQLKNQAREPMYAVSKGVFVTASGARVAFADDGDQVTINNFERMPTAGVSGTNVTVVASR